MASFSYRSAVQVDDSSGSSATANATLPSGTTSGDGQIIGYMSGVVTGGGAPTHTTPSGWTLVGSSTFTNISGLDGRFSLFAKVAGGSEGTVTLTSNKNCFHTVRRLTYQNAHPTDFVSGISPTFATTASSTSHAVASVTPGRANAMAWYMLVGLSAVATWTAASGTTERTDQQSTCTDDLIQTTAGATGSKTFTCSATNRCATVVAVFYSSEWQTSKALSASTAVSADIDRAAELIRAAATTAAAGLSRTVSAMRSAAASVVGDLEAMRTKLLTLVASVGALAAVERAVSVVRSAQVSAVAVVSRAISATRSAGVSAAASVSSIRIRLLTLSAAVGATAMVARGAQITRGAVVATGAGLQRGASIVRAASSVVLATRQAAISAIRAASNTVGASIAAQRARLLTLIASVATAASVSRRVNVVRSAVAVTSAQVQRLVSLTRTGIAGAIGSIESSRLRMLVLLASVTSAAQLQRVVAIVRVATSGVSAAFAHASSVVAQLAVAMSAVWSKRSAAVTALRRSTVMRAAWRAIKFTVKR